jgi:hypothetical protein
MVHSLLSSSCHLSFSLTPVLRAVNADPPHGGIAPTMCVVQGGGEVGCGVEGLGLMSEWARPGVGVGVPDGLISPARLGVQRSVLLPLLALRRLLTLPLHRGSPPWAVCSSSFPSCPLVRCSPQPLRPMLSRPDAALAPTCMDRVVNNNPFESKVLRVSPPRMPDSGPPRCQGLNAPRLPALVHSPRGLWRVHLQ